MNLVDNLGGVSLRRVDPGPGDERLCCPLTREERVVDALARQRIDQASRVSEQEPSWTAQRDRVLRLVTDSRNWPGVRDQARMPMESVLLDPGSRLHAEIG